MPFILRKVYKRNCYSVKSKKSKRVHAKCTRQEKSTITNKIIKWNRKNPKFREALRKNTKTLEFP